MVFPNCLSILFCVLDTGPWLGLALAVCPTLVILAVLLAECLAFDRRRCDTPLETEHSYTDAKEKF